MTNQARDAQPPSSRILTSEGKSEAQVYATAEVHDSTRPTMEMDRVQYTDPRKQITVKTVRPAAAQQAMPRIGSPRVPDFDDELGVRPTLLRDDGSERPTIPRDDEDSRPTLLRDDGGDHPTLPMVARAPATRAAAPAAPRRNGFLVAASAIVVLAVAGAWMLRAPRHEGAAAPAAPTAEAMKSAPAMATLTADPTPAPPAAPAPSAEAAAAAVAARAPPVDTTTATAPERAPAPTSRPQAPRPAVAAAKPSAAPRAEPAPAPAPAPATPAKGRLFGVE